MCPVPDGDAGLACRSSHDAMDWGMLAHQVVYTSYLAGAAPPVDNWTRG